MTTHRIGNTSFTLIELVPQSDTVRRETYPDPVACPDCEGSTTSLYTWDAEPGERCWTCHLTSMRRVSAARRGLR